MHLDPKGQHSVMHQDTAHCVPEGISGKCIRPHLCPAAQGLSLATSEPMETWTGVWLC